MSEKKLSEMTDEEFDVWLKSYTEEYEKRAAIFAEVLDERERQDKKWGEQNHEICYEAGSVGARHYSDLCKRACEAASLNRRVTWHDILAEEVAEVYAESDPAKQRAELVQVCAVVFAMIECLDRKAGK